MPGTYTKRGNSYRLKVVHGTNFKGEPNQYTKTVHCTTDKQAEKELSIFYADVVKGNVDKGHSATIGALCDKWLELCVDNNVKRSTYVSYEKIIENSLKPSLGNYKVDKLRTIHIQEWVKELTESLAPKTVVGRYTVLNSVLSKAVVWGFISQNPCKNVTLPKVKREEAKYYRKDQVVRLLELIENESAQHRLIVMLTLFTGVRMGELAGLKWDAVYEDHIEIRETRIYRKKYGVYVEHPKTEKSKRKISIPKECYELLKETRKEQMLKKVKLGSKWEDTEYVLAGQFGGALFPPRISQWWREFCDRTGFEKITFHQLRHTHTSMLASMNIPQIQISRRLGHSQMSTTMNIYTHLFESVEDEISNQMSNEFLKKKEIVPISYQTQGK